MVMFAIEQFSRRPVVFAGGLIKNGGSWVRRQLLARWMFSCERELESLLGCE